MADRFWRQTSFETSLTNRFIFVKCELCGWDLKFMLNSSVILLLQKYTLVENYSKCLIGIFWHFPPIFVPLKLTCRVTLFDRKYQVFKNSPNRLFGILYELLSTQNVSVACFARNVKWDFFCNFQTLCNVITNISHHLKPYFWSCPTFFGRNFQIEFSVSNNYAC